jgi:peptidyl-prolyl cis-trans isomerase SurA
LFIEIRLRSIFVKFRITRLGFPLVFALLLMLAPLRVFAQEGELQVVDEVIAQVNDDIITLSMLKREMKEQIEALKQNGGMTEQQATDEVTKNRNKLIATLVNQQLLLQKGKELDFGQRVEDEVNRRFLDIMKEQGFKDIINMEKAMKDSGIDPAAMRTTMRAEIMKQAVLQEEVDSKIYFNTTPDELHKYFEANKDKFKKPENVTLSEIYLSLAGKDPAAVKARVAQLMIQLRAGADFKANAVANSEREANGKRVAPETGGLVGTFEVPNLRQDIADAIKSVPAGKVSEPLVSNDGFQILRVDAREAGSDASVFNENLVREAITRERAPKGQEDYLQTLRNEAYIRVSENYHDGVASLLNLKPEAIVEKTDDGGPITPEKKKGKKFLKIFPRP